MGVINNGMSIMGLDSNLQKTVKGLVLMAAVVFDVVSKREVKLFRWRKANFIVTKS